MHQPSYFPWLGLLNKVNNSDAFVVMDEVQLSDNGYQHRNLFLTADCQPKFLTIPFVKKDYRRRAFKDIEIAASDWGVRHFNFISNSYRNHPFAEVLFPALAKFYHTKFEFLLDAVLMSMRMSFSLFKICTEVILQSSLDYDRSLRRTELVIALARAAGATCYLSGAGAKSYLVETSFPEDLHLLYNEFNHPEYAQKGTASFVSGLSCLDSILNIGSNAACRLLGESKSAG